MLSPPETDTSPGETRGTQGELGNWLRERVCGTGGQVRRDAGNGQPGLAGRRAGRGPSISYMEGPRLILPDEVILPEACPAD
jgi:hypothetical protein